MKVYYFENLDVWKNARILAKDVYQITNSFPDNEKFGITNQIRRATLSISANIAEGISRKTTKDKARFINQAYSSGIEVLNFIIIALDLSFLSEENYTKLRSQIELITNQLNSFYNKLKNSE